MKFGEYLEFLLESKDDEELKDGMVVWYKDGDDWLKGKLVSDKNISTSKKEFWMVNSFTNRKTRDEIRTEKEMEEIRKQKNLKESNEDYEFSKDDIKTLKSLKFRINSDNNTATMDFFAGGTVARIIVITAAEFGAVDIKIVRYMKQENPHYELKDIDLEESKKNLPAIIQELQDYIEAETDFDVVWDKL